MYFAICALLISSSTMIKAINPNDQFLMCYVCDSEYIGNQHLNPLCISPNDQSNSYTNRNGQTIKNQLCSGICYTEITPDKNIYRACLTKDELIEYYEFSYHKYFKKEKKICKEGKNHDLSNECLQEGIAEALKMVEKDPVSGNFLLSGGKHDKISKKASDGSLITFCKSKLCNDYGNRSMHEKYISMRSTDSKDSQIKVIVPEVEDYISNSKSNVKDENNNSNLSKSLFGRFTSLQFGLVVILIVMGVLGTGFVIYRYTNGRTKHHRISTGS